MSVTPAERAIGSQTAEQHGAKKNIFPDAQRDDSRGNNDPREAKQPRQNNQPRLDKRDDRLLRIRLDQCPHEARADEARKAREEDHGSGSVKITSPREADPSRLHRRNLEQSPCSG